MSSLHVLLFFCFFILAAHLDAFESLVNVTREYEDYELDEVFTLLIISSFVFAIMLFRVVKRLDKEIDNRIENEEKVRKLAFYDPLTALPNRALCMNRFDHILEQATRKNEFAAILFIDLDNFKQVNDTYGHDCGDMVLKEMSVRLAKQIRKGDTLSRFAGDEFIVLLDTVTTSDNAATLAKKLLHCLKQPLHVDGIEVQIGISIGIAVFPDDGSDGLTLLKHADIAMYQAKKAEKNTYRFYSKELNDKVRNKQSIANQMRNAIAQNEFEIYFQPIIDVKTKNIIGAEALLRWDNQSLGKISPNVFIPIAEEIGMMEGIGEWALTHACEQTQSWHRKGYPITVSVNISIKQLVRGNFLNVVQRCLNETKLSAKYLEFEFSEISIISDLDLVLVELEKLKKLGVSIALDHFGTGYSSIAYLRKSTISRIKIDRDFVKDIPNNQKDVTATIAIISLAKQLDIAITVEGVETREQQAFFNETAVDSAQGYLIGRPMNKEDFEGLLATF